MTKFLPFIDLPIFLVIFGLGLLLVLKRSKRKSKVWKVILKILGCVMIIVSVIVIGMMKFDMSIAKERSLTNNTPKVVENKSYKTTIDTFTQTNEIPGMIIGIIDEDGEHIYSYGYSHISPNIDVTPETLFEIGSISKVFTGLILSESVGRGEVNLDDSVLNYIDSENDVFEKIKLSHLTTHTSGLPTLPSQLMEKIPLHIALNDNPYKNFDVDDLKNYMSEITELNHEVGTTFEYSNFGVGMLGAALATSHDTSYETLLKEYVLLPLELTSTTTAELKKREIATGYRYIADAGSIMLAIKNAYWHMEDGIVGCGGVRSNGYDMMKFLRASMSDDYEFVSRSKESLFTVDDATDIGMGWIISKNIFEDEIVVWHNGQTGGFNSFIGFVEGKNKGVFIIANSPLSIQGLAFELLELN